jgi:hypothetical protein
MASDLLVTPLSASVGLVSTSIASTSAAVGYGLGWLLQECRVSLPLLAVGVAVTALA